MRVPPHRFKRLEFQDAQFWNILHYILIPLTSPTTDAQLSFFFGDISNFWAWVDKLGLQILGHLGYFWLDYRTPF
jgi:hypothetical protein